MEEGEDEGLDLGECGLLRAVQGVSAKCVLGAKGARPVSLPPHCGCFFPGGLSGALSHVEQRAWPRLPIAPSGTARDVCRRCQKFPGRWTCCCLETTASEPSHPFWPLRHGVRDTCLSVKAKCSLDQKLG